MSTSIEPELVFDRQSALQRLQGDAELLAEVAELFLVTSPGKLDEIRKAVHAGEAVLIAQSAHALKSSVGNFSAKLAHEAAFKLEIIGREERVVEAADAFTDLEREVTRLQSTLQEFLNKATKHG